MRYYEREHVNAYARIKDEGLDQWNDLHETPAGFDQFPNRAFLERVLPAVAGDDRLRVPEYGCGTGPAACNLAARGYQVRGIDLVPDAIDIARRRAAERGLSVQFAVEDICRWDDHSEAFDVVLDSYCLQSIVVDRDRTHVFDGVRRRLDSGGGYVVSTAMYEPTRDYGDDHFDPATGIVWTPSPGPAADARQIDDGWYLPHRRHVTAAALRGELENHGFCILEQSEAGGDVVSTVAP